MVIRRNPSVDMESALGVLFDDRHIIFHHLLYGDCVALNEFGYVYVNYKTNSICEYGNRSKDEIALMQCLDPITRIQAVPQWAGLYMKYNGVRGVSNAFRYRNDNIKLVNNKKWTYRQYRGFIFDYYSKSRRTVSDHIRAFVLRWLFLIIKKSKISGGSRFYRALYAMATSRTEAHKIPIEYWRCNI